MKMTTVTKVLMMPRWGMRKTDNDTDDSHDDDDDGIMPL